MRAWSLTAPGLEHLSLEERREPVPGPNEVRVRIKAASLNYRDLMIATGRYSRGAKYPLVPLSDGAGEVAAVGSGVAAWRVGDRVTTSFFAGWEDGPQTAERAGTALGGAVDGVLAEAVVLPARGIVRTPEHMSDIEAATLPCAALTAWHALFDRVRRIFVGSVSMFEAMNRALSLHRVRPVVDQTFRFDEVRAALEHMQKASHFGKIVLVA